MVPLKTGFRKRLDVPQARTASGHLVMALSSRSSFLAYCPKFDLWMFCSVLFLPVQLLASSIDLPSLKSGCSSLCYCRIHSACSSGLVSCCPGFHHATP